MFKALFFSFMCFLSASIYADENAKAAALFEEIFQQDLARSPLYQTSIGVKTDYDRWDDMSEKFAEQGQRLRHTQMKRLAELDRSKLDDDTLLSLRILEHKLQSEIDFFPWRHHNYPFHQMGGMHTLLVSVLLNEQSIDSEADARAYISRLKKISVVFDQLLKGQELRTKKGIIPPDFVIDMVIESSENIISGAPFEVDAKTDSALYADFKAKVNKLDLPEKTREKLVRRAEAALEKQVASAYKRLIASMQALRKKADNKAGVWKFPDGKAYYAAALKDTTTTDLSAEEIHDMGLAEVARIHDEMRAIMRAVKFEGNLQEFFEFMREDDRFYYPDSDEGRNQYLDDAVALVQEIKGRLGEVFVEEAKADLIVKRVEPYREKSAGMAFYQPGTPDGSRPGIFYANLSNMREVPNYEIAALVYHEGLPGHHMQISIARELESIPSFRKYVFYTAYVEGWGLYSELLPKEMGLYQDPYSDFGRLGLELWRACRLVVDTGMHHHKWTREQAVEYLMDNTPAAKPRAERSIDRYIVIPSQATAYKIGMLKILELREKAKEALGEQFDLRQFHQQILAAGPVPLSIMEERIDSWVDTFL